MVGPILVIHEVVQHIHPFAGIVLREVLLYARIQSPVEPLIDGVLYLLILGREPLDTGVFQQLLH